MRVRYDVAIYIIGIPYNCRSYIISRKSRYCSTMNINIRVTRRNSRGDKFIRLSENGPFFTAPNARCHMRGAKMPLLTVYVNGIHVEHWIRFTRYSFKEYCYLLFHYVSVITNLLFFAAWQDHLSSWECSMSVIFYVDRNELPMIWNSINTKMGWPMRICIGFVFALIRVNSNIGNS